MRYIKLPLSEADYERLATIAAARDPEPTLPALAIAALNECHQLQPPIPPPRRVGNPEAAQVGREVAARRRGTHCIRLTP